MPWTVTTEREDYRFSAECLNDDCTEGLDTYGREEVLQMAMEHVAQYGCHVDVQVKSLIKVRPADEIGTKTGRMSASKTNLSNLPRP